MVDYQEVFETRQKVHDLEMNIDKLLRQVGILQELIEVVIAENERLRNLLKKEA